KMVTRAIQDFTECFRDSAVTSSSLSAAMRAAGSTSNLAKRRGIFIRQQWKRPTGLSRTKPNTWGEGAGWRKTAASRPTQLFTGSKLAMTKHGKRTRVLL